MNQIRSYLEQAIADELQLKAHYEQIAQAQRAEGNFDGWSKNSTYAFFIQDLIDSLTKVRATLSEISEVEDQAWS